MNRSKVQNIITSVVFMTAVTSSVFGYDIQKAEQLNKFYAPLTQKACANSKLFIDAQETMKMLKEQKKFLLLDVRTPAEYRVIALGVANSLHIPISELFQKENLDKLPTDKTIVVVCHSGTRATMAAIALKQIGITKTRVLKGGIVALAEANNVKNAPATVQ